ncbi:MAG TPA: hypothetical protein VI911_06020 [Patescibacteria group bacterium]|nr:hypothetical protein [Patescibacteria group bacterium]
MTNLEAIKAKMNYPLSENAFILALQDRGLASAGIYSGGESFDLAYADAITTLVTVPNVVEGGYQVSLADKTTLLSLAAGIYTKYSAVNPIPASSLKKTATFVQRF